MVNHKLILNNKFDPYLGLFITFTVVAIKEVTVFILNTDKSKLFVITLNVPGILT